MRISAHRLPIVLACLFVMAGATLMPWTVARAEGGHCDFRQYAPQMKQWFQACAMPTTAAACSAMGSARNKGNSSYAPGICNTSGVTGVCVVNGQKVYFYQGSDKVLAEGCEWLHGIWRPDLMLKLDSASTAEVLE